MARTLNTLDTHASATVVAINVEGQEAIRLMEMGFVPGTRVTVLRRAWSGQPLHISMRDSSVSLNDDEAAYISIT